jgi:hypothetical protein
LTETPQDKTASGQERPRPSLLSRAFHVALWGALLLAGQEAALRSLFPLPQISNFNRARYARVGELAPLACAHWDVSSLPADAERRMALNIYGFRDAKDWSLVRRAGTKRVAFLGGSLVEGVGVGDDETLPEIYSREARRSDAVVEVMNLGMTGADLGASFQAFRDVTKLFAPHEAFLVLHSEEPRLLPYDPAWLQGPIEPVFPKRWLPRAAHIFRRYSRHEGVPFRLWRPAVPLEPLLQKPHLGREEAAPSLAVDLTSSLSAFERFTRANGCALRVIYLPEAGEADPQASPPEIGLAATVSAVCRRLGVPFLDLTADLRREQGRGNALYWEGSPYLRPRGQATVAQRLWEWSQHSPETCQPAASLWQLPTTAAQFGLVPPESVYYTGLPDLDRIQAFFHPTLEANFKQFRGRFGVVSGFGAGATYPQVWLRDSNTLLPLVRYTFEGDVLASWLMEHLAAQQDGGQLFDWIAAGPIEAFREWAPHVRVVFRKDEQTLCADKNTTETDQEASAVLSAHRVFMITGDREWLRSRVLGRSVVERCDRALEYVLKRKLDKQTGLVVSALTADWGDVSPVYPDQRSIYIDEKTPLGVGLYTNALVSEAAHRLGELWAAVGNATRSNLWHERAGDLRQRINAHLWQGERGFYRMHLPVEADSSPLGDDSNIFALGGHVVALRAGVPDETQAERIFEVEERRRQGMGREMPGVTLMPPFKDGVFLNPVLSRAGCYQNGGHWDWFAGHYVLAEFEWGHSRRALKHLEALARVAVRTGGLFEWRAPDGGGRGSRHYGASAASLSQAIYGGLFGIDLRGDQLDIHVRLGNLPATLYLQQPATHTLVAYRYEFDETGNVLRLRYESSLLGNGTISILLPQNASVIEMRRDGQIHPFTVTTVGEDVFVALATDWRPHLVEVAFDRMKQ